MLPAWPGLGLQVTFELHHTFNNPQRAVEVQPYEVTENGWGEFEIKVTVSRVRESTVEGALN